MRPVHVRYETILTQNFKLRFLTNIVALLGNVNFFVGIVLQRYEDERFYPSFHHTEKNRQN
jgi:hypothetical protein